MMRCTKCHEDVDESRAMPLHFTVTSAEPLADGTRNLGTYDGHFHLRYVSGILPEGPETTRQHVGPVVCGPLE
jgi:hypothetical protein